MKNSTWNKALMVIDVQEAFLWNKNEIISNFEDSIVSEVSDAIHNWIKVILVEYLNHWSTSSKIKKELDWYENCLVIQKNSDGLLDDFQNNKKYAKIAKDKLKNAWVNDIKLVWLHAPVCIRDSAVWLRENGFNPEILLDKTIDIQDMWLFDSYNQIKHVMKKYKKVWIDDIVNYWSLDEKSKFIYEWYK